MKDLLQPRFIVVAEYPYSNLNVGDIFTPMNGNSHIEYTDNGGKIEINFSDYPHLFRPLHWSEFRTLDEMPKYMKDINTGEIYEAYHDLSFGGKYPYTSRIPATEAEYTNFINQAK